MLNASHVDNTPNSIIEALASGVLVISSSVGGIPFLVKDKKTALLISENTPERMAETIQVILKNKELQNRLIKNGLELVKQFSWDNVRKQLFDTYKVALDKKENKIT